MSERAKQPARVLRVHRVSGPPAPPQVAGWKTTASNALAAARAERRTSTQLVPATAPVDLPFRERMERFFGRSFAGLETYLGEAVALAGFGARGAALEDKILLAAASPDPAVVAHELAHVVQLQRENGHHAPDAIPPRPIAEPAEREADSAARALSRGSTSARVTERPRAPVLFDNSTTPPEEQLDPAVEADILGLLQQRLAANDVPRIQARVTNLMTIFRAIPQDVRLTLHARLAVPAADDALANALVTRLHPATRTRLLRVLLGEPVPLPVRHDAMTPEGFVAYLPDAPFVIEPDPLVIHPRLAPTVTASVSVEGEYGPPSDGPPVTLVVRVFDADGGEHGVERVSWPLATPQSPPAAFTFDSAGAYPLACEVIQGGLLIARRAGSISVSEPAAEIKRQAFAQNAGTSFVGVFAGALAALAAQKDADLAAVLELSPQQLTDAYRRMTAQLATETDPAKRKRIAEDRNLIEFAAAQQKVPLGELPEDYSADPAFVRAWIEKRFIDGGMAAVDDLDKEIDGLIAKERASDADDPMSYAWLSDQLAPEMVRQREIFKKEVDEYEGTFDGRARELTQQTLDDSYAIAQKEFGRYGLHVDQHTTTFTAPDDLPGKGHQTVTITRVSGADNDEAQKMGDAAAELAANQREMDRLRARLSKLEGINKYLLCIHGYGGETFGGCPQIPVFPLMNTDVREQELPGLIAALQRVVTQAEQAHADKISALTAEFPLLASYKKTHDDVVDVDADGLDRLRSSATRAWEIYDRIVPVLNKIETTRENVKHGDLSIWKEPRVVKMTMADLLVAPESLRGAIVRERVATAQERSWWDWALMALTIGLAIVAAIPTGGSSIVAAVVVTASIADATLSAYQLAQHIKEYSIEEAAAGTDLDQARAISADHPSLLWLALDIVMTGIGIGGAAKTFEHVAADLARAGRMTERDLEVAIANVNRLAREGKMSVEAAELAEYLARAPRMTEKELQAAIADVDQIAREGKITAEAADQIKNEMRAARAAGIDATAIGEGAEGTAERVARFDLRARVTADHLEELSERLGVPVELDESLGSGVEMHYETKPGALGIGTDIEPTIVRVGKNALLEDVLAHEATITRVTKYNGILGKLRSLWDRLVSDAETLTNPFPKGSLAWESWEEMSKLDELIELRRARWNPRTLDAQTLDEDIAFLDGRRAYHEEIVASAEETGMVKGVGHVDAPDVEKVTAEARANDYRLPGPPDQPNANPDYYYYRNSRTAPGEYELVRKPSAPEDTVPYRAVVKNGKFVDLEEAAIPKPRALITAAMSDDDVVVRLYEDASFKKFAKMLNEEGIATPEEIDKAIRSARTTGKDILHDTLRGKVKDLYRDRIIAKLADPALDDAASYTQMRRMLDPLEAGDRGNLAEAWYQARYAKQGVRHVAARVVRTGDLAGQVEDRVIDVVDKDGAIEVKDIIGPIPKDQYEAYVDMLVQELEVAGPNGPTAIKRLTYVFTKPEGARANLTFFAEELKNVNLQRNLTVIVFDSAGTRYIIRDAATAETVLAKLGGPL